MLYNLCGVPIAAGVLYPLLHVRLPPALAGLTMALSSISVVMSSLALRLYSKPKVCMWGGYSLTLYRGRIPRPELGWFGPASADRGPVQIVRISDGPVQVVWVTVGCSRRVRMDQGSGTICLRASSCR